MSQPEAKPDWSGRCALRCVLRSDWLGADRCSAQRLPPGGGREAALRPQTSGADPPGEQEVSSGGEPGFSLGSDRNSRKQNLRPTAGQNRFVLQ